MSDASKGRTLGDLSGEEREEIVQAIQQEAQEAGWHKLNNQGKSGLYKHWEDRFGLSHVTLKDSIMKGFDAAQHIPPSGEEGVHQTLLGYLSESPIPYVRSKVRRPEWRREVDFVLGFSESFLTHITELEPAPTWHQGLMQALLYKSLYYQATGVQALPTLILFGDSTAQRFEEIKTVCVDQRVLLLAHELLVDGESPPNRMLDLLWGGP